MFDEAGPGPTGTESNKKAKTTHTPDSTKSIANGVQVLHLLVGSPMSGKTTWVERKGKNECCGFCEREIRLLMETPGSPLSTIAISTTHAKDIESSDDALSLKATMFVRRALGWLDTARFTVKVLRFERIQKPVSWASEWRQEGADSPPPLEAVD